MGSDGHLRRLSLGKAAAKGPNEAAREFRDLLARDDPGVDVHRPSRVKREEEERVGSPEDTPLLWETSNRPARWQRAQDRSSAGCNA